MKKRGQVTEQFNWIFAIIAGGIILMFFTFVIVQIKSVSDAKLASEVINNFDAILSGSEASPNTLTIMESTESLKFEVNCDPDNFDTSLSITEADVVVPLGNKNVFSPKDISGNLLYIYTDPIEIPFYIANALLISDSKTIFFFHDISNSLEIKQMYELVPDNFTKKISSLFPSSLKSFDKVVVVSNEKPDLEDATLAEDYKILKKLNVNWFEVNGNEITYYQKTSKEKSFEDLGTVSVSENDFKLYLFFSKDLDNYECNYNKITRKARNVAKIFSLKAEQLYDTATEDKCKFPYGSAQSLFDEIAGENLGFYYDPFAEGISESLVEKNDILLKASCPLLY